MRQEWQVAVGYTGIRKEEYTDIMLHEAYVRFDVIEIILRIQVVAVQECLSFVALSSGENMPAAFLESLHSSEDRNEIQTRVCTKPPMHMRGYPEAEQSPWCR